MKRCRAFTALRETIPISAARARPYCSNERLLEGKKAHPCHPSSHRYTSHTMRSDICCPGTPLLQQRAASRREESAPMPPFLTPLHFPYHAGWAGESISSQLFLARVSPACDHEW